MRTTLNIDDELLSEAERVTGVSEKTALVRAGLKALIESNRSFPPVLDVSERGQGVS